MGVKVMPFAVAVGLSFPVEAGPVLFADKTYVLERETYAIAYPFPGIVRVFDAHADDLIEVFNRNSDAQGSVRHQIATDVELWMYPGKQRADNPNCKSVTATIRAPATALEEFSIFSDPDLSEAPVFAYNFFANCRVEDVAGVTRYPVFSYSPGNCATCGDDRYWLEKSEDSDVLRLMQGKWKAGD